MTYKVKLIYVRLTMAAIVSNNFNVHEILSKKFVSASNFVRKMTERLSGDNLLFLYARFKQVNDGNCNVPKPYFYDLKGKQKWVAWKHLENIPKDQAMQEYIDYLTVCCPNWEKEVEVNVEGLGITVSKMMYDEDDIEDCDKTICDWVKEGHVQNVEKCLKENQMKNINKLDEEGMSLLHWACDRGLEEVAVLLLQHKADTNTKDSDGQTPLHFAVECQHFCVVKLLLDNLANITIKDYDGISPLDIETSTSIHTLLETYGKQMTQIVH